MPPRLSTGSAAQRPATSARTSSACRNSSRDGSWPERQAKLTATPARSTPGRPASSAATAGAASGRTPSRRSPRSTVSRTWTEAPGACSPSTRAAPGSLSSTRSGDLRRGRELVPLGRADERERPQVLPGEPGQRGQATVGESGAAGLEQHPPDRRLAVHALGDAAERQPARVQVRREPSRRVGDGVQVDREPGEGHCFSTSSAGNGYRGSLPACRPRAWIGSELQRGAGAAAPAGRGRDSAGVARGCGRGGARQWRGY